MNKVGFFATSILVALALLSSMVFVVDQRQFGVVYALGQIKEAITEPGLEFQAPAAVSECVLHRQEGSRQSRRGNGRHPRENAD